MSTVYPCRVFNNTVDERKIIMGLKSFLIEEKQIQYFYDSITWL